VISRIHRIIPLILWNEKEERFVWWLDNSADLETKMYSPRFLSMKGLQLALNGKENQKTKKKIKT
jgi:hypothetical protein